MFISHLEIFNADRVKSLQENYIKLLLALSNQLFWFTLICPFYVFFVFGMTCCVIDFKYMYIFKDMRSTYLRLYYAQ